MAYLLFLEPLVVLLLAMFLVYNWFSFIVKDPARACYGPKHVEIAHERMAVQTLLVTDDLFRLVSYDQLNIFGNSFRLNEI